MRTKTNIVFTLFIVFLNVLFVSNCYSAILGSAISLNEERQGEENRDLPIGIQNVRVDINSARIRSPDGVHKRQ